MNRYNLFIRMYKHHVGNYQPNFHFFVSGWCQLNIPNYKALKLKYGWDTVKKDVKYKVWK
jgi:hypothetical protein